MYDLKDKIYVEIPQLFKIPANLLGTPLIVIPGVKIHLRVGEQQVETVHPSGACKGSHDWCPAMIAPLVDGGQVLSGKERCHPFVVVPIHSIMKSTVSTAINFVDVNLWVVEQQLHHIVLAFG